MRSAKPETAVIEIPWGTFLSFGKPLPNQTISFLPANVQKTSETIKNWGTVAEEKVVGTRRLELLTSTVSISR
jgi:hypothetical protein